MEKAIAESFAKMLLVDQVDQWGIVQPNPVRQALAQYVEENKDKFFLEVLKTVTVEKIADAMSDRLLEVAKGVYGSSWDREQIIKDLKSKVAEHMSKKIAEDLKI